MSRSDAQSPARPCRLGDRLCGTTADCVGCAGPVASDAATFSGAMVRHSAMWSTLGVSVALVAGRLAWKTDIATIAGFAFVAATASLLMWWGTLQPSHQRVWADDVAQLLEARNRRQPCSPEKCTQLRVAQRNRLHPAVGEPHIRSGPLAQRRPGAFLLDGAAHRAHTGVVRLRRWRAGGVLTGNTQGAPRILLGGRRILPSVRADPGSRR